ncbi:glycosyltransferase, partial [Patescibacteria group bacterium]|nr:glycosyltransferase [Patescibacteria group bacterium]
KWEAADIAEKINRTAKNPDEAKKIAERGFEDVQQFEYHKAIKNFTDKYLKIINNDHIKESTLKKFQAKQ